MKQKETDFEPKTLGEHIKKRRLELKLTQPQASYQLGINPATLLNWEKGKTTPPLFSLASIHRFLGYDPYPPAATTIAERLIAKRRQQGWTIRRCAKVLGIDPGTLGNWERGETILFRKHRRIVARFLDITEAEIEKVMSRGGERNTVGKRVGNSQFKNGM